jgi:hypothetical protein
MIQTEIDLGHFRDDLPIKTMAHFLYTISSSISEYMQTIHSVNFEHNLEADQALLSGTKALLIQSIDEYILLLKTAFNKTL